ncbi:MAG: hypothetical protein AAFZ07_13945 [Actinomycetota bacterium]
MAMGRMGGRGLILGGVIVLVAACGGGSSFDRDEAIDDMVATGLDRPDAECVVDAMVEEFGEDTLGSDDEPSPEQVERMVDLTTDCVLGVADDAGSGGDGGGEEAGGGEPVAVELFSDSDFAPACRGNGIASASPYSPGDGTNLTVVLEGEDPDYGFSAVQLPDGWEADFESYAQAELVICLNRVSATPTQVCDGYEDDGIAWSVQLHDSTYEVSVREATTGTVLATQSFDAPAEDCPVFSSYSEGDPNPKPEFDAPDAEIEVFAAEFVTGSAAAAPAEEPAAEEPVGEEPADAPAVPNDYGDDPTLDALWDGCEGGDLAACDELYWTTPVGSVYEEFGATCGRRTDGSTTGLCAES